jgi:hypothetical protein
MFCEWVGSRAFASAENDDLHLVHAYASSGLQAFDYDCTGASPSRAGYFAPAGLPSPRWRKLNGLISDRRTRYRTPARSGAQHQQVRQNALIH